MRWVKIPTMLQKELSVFNNKKRLKNYVSEIDQFLAELYNMPGAKSDTRIEEEQKYQRIFALRDHPQAQLAEEVLWKDT